jgi:hypothetical protein
LYLLVKLILLNGDRDFCCQDWQQINFKQLPMTSEIALLDNQVGKQLVIENNRHSHASFDLIVSKVPRPIRVALKRRNLLR